jgi:hypothetical protein
MCGPMVLLVTIVSVRFSFVIEVRSVMEMVCFSDVGIRVWASALWTSFAELWKLYLYVVVYC